MKREGGKEKRKRGMDEWDDNEVQKGEIKNGDTVKMNVRRKNRERK